MLADQRKIKKSALTPKGLRLLRETPFGTPGLAAISARVAGDNFLFARHPPHNLGSPNVGLDSNPGAS